MSRQQLAVTDLPLGIAATEHPYNALIARGIGRLDAGDEISARDIEIMARERLRVWSAIQTLKDQGMKGYARGIAHSYGFELDGDGGLRFDWKREGFARIGFESQCYGFEPATKTLEPVDLDVERARLVVFCTGRAFAERNARLLHLTPEQSMDNARDIMSAQSYLVQSRLVPDAGPSAPQVAAFAYDMVTSEYEVPAIRLQAVLEPEFVHPVCTHIAERLFGPLIADAELTERGTFVRRDGKIRGRLKSDEEVVRAIDRLVLVGASVGCLLALQAGRYLASLLAELGASSSLIDEALGAFLVLNLGLASMPEVDPRINHLAVINRWDEFVYAGHDTAPIVARAERTHRRLVPYRDAAGREGVRSHVVLLDVPATVGEDDKGRAVFDPDGTHFGHSMKHYVNALRDRGLPRLLERFFSIRGPFEIGELVEECEAAGELYLTL